MGKGIQHPWVGRLVALLVAMAAVLATSAPGRAATSSWDLSSDWMVGANPDGAWSYGWESSRGSSFTLMTLHAADSSIPGTDYWSGGIQGVGGPFYPEVGHNGSSTTYDFSCCTYPGNSVVMHPGPDGQNAVVRWTAPAAGSYDVRATWSGNDKSGTTTDDAVLLGGTQQLFAGEVTGYLATQRYTGTVSMVAGQTLDFTVGFGSDGSYFSDSTGVAVTIAQAAPVDTTPPDVAPIVTGTPGANGWYTSDVHVSWSVTDAQSQVASTSGCGPADVTTDTDAAGITFSCTATSAGGTTAKSVTVKRDATPPTVAYSGNAGTYDVDQTVDITCAATDGSSGVASTTCADITGSAASFAVGPNTFSATATDKAGNVGSGSTAFTLVVTPRGMAALTTRYLQGSPKYQALNPVQRGVVLPIANGVAQAMPAAIARASAQRKLRLISAYGHVLDGLVSAGWLSAEQAATLVRLAAGL